MHYYAILSFAADNAPSCTEKESNLFVKPDEQSQTCLNFAMARKGLLKMNLFVKPDEQSQTCLNFAMAKKGLMKLNLF